MAKNELLPFANGEDANVLPTNQWEALTDILENGFQSGIAKSEQVNRVLAQGAVASYVLGQLIVDQLNKDATLDKSALYQNLILALQENAKDACLPLSGGTVSGILNMSSNSIQAVAHLELIPNSNTNGGYIDFHFGGNNSVDFTSRIIEDQSGALNLIASSGMKVNNKPVVHVTETWNNGYSWYRKWSDGWIQQGGLQPEKLLNTTISLHVPFTNTNYTVLGTKNNGEGEIRFGGFTTTSFNWSSAEDTTAGFWYAFGY